MRLKYTVVYFDIQYLDQASRNGLDIWLGWYDPWLAEKSLTTFCHGGLMPHMHNSL